MYGDQGAELDLTQPRSVGQILGTALRLYGRQPLLFLFLAAIVVVPYQIVVVLVEHGSHHLRAGTELVLVLVAVALIAPLISALQVQALLDIGAGARPRIPDVIQRGLRVLPATAAAQIVAAIGIAVGFVFFIIPGILLALRWAVVAPTAAAEQTDWPSALRRSGQLTRRNYWRILGLLIIVAVVNDVASAVIGTGNLLSKTVLGIVLAIIVQSFSTLLITLLYFDLRARESAPVA